MLKSTNTPALIHPTWCDSRLCRDGQDADSRVRTVEHRSLAAELPLWGERRIGTATITTHQVDELHDGEWQPASAPEVALAVCDAGGHSTRVTLAQADVAQLLAALAAAGARA